jgi:streptogramin lyase
VSASLCTRRRPRRALWLGASLTAGLGLLAVSFGSAASAQSARPEAASKPPPYGTLWVTAASTENLLEFAPGANGEAAPIADISGAATELNNPAGMAIDHHGRLWVANFSTATILVFGADATGNVKPVMTLGGAKTGLNDPSGIAMAQNGDLWVANSGSNTLAEFAAGAHGNVAPIRTIGGSLTLLANLNGIAVSPDGTRVWICEERSKRAKVPPVLEEFAGTAHGNVKPLVEISGSKTRLYDPYGIAVGVDGTDPIVDNTNPSTPSLLQFPPGAHGNVAPTVITGDSTGLSEPRFLAVDAVGNIWIPNALNDLLIRFAPSQVGDAAPGRLLFGVPTMLNTPGSVAVFLAAPGAPRVVHAHGTKHTLRLSWSSPRVTGGGILGYRVRRAHKKSGPWTVVATTTKRSYKKSHPHKGFYYDIEAFNDGGYSAATPAKLPKL